MHRSIAAFLIAFALTGPAFAEGFQRVAEKDRFLQLIGERDLTRFAIRVKVTSGGDIVGRAFGQRVSGEWAWQDGYFCRSLFWGKQEIGDNCQTVEVLGETLRFTSDRGTGQFADLKLD